MGYCTNALKQATLEGRPSLGTGSLEARDAATIATIAAAGFDFVFIDLEHSSLSIETAAALVAHSHGVGITPMVRVPLDERAGMTRILDAGCQTLIVPQIRSAVDVRSVLERARYTPAGRRGIARWGSASMNYANVGDAAEYLRFANDNMFVGINIETPEAVDDLEAILMPGSIS